MWVRVCWMRNERNKKKNWWEMSEWVRPKTIRFWFFSIFFSSLHSGVSRWAFHGFFLSLTIFFSGLHVYACVWLIFSLRSNRFLLDVLLLLLFLLGVVFFSSLIFARRFILQTFRSKWASDSYILFVRSLYIVEPLRLFSFHWLPLRWFFFLFFFSCGPFFCLLFS